MLWLRPENSFRESRKGGRGKRKKRKGEKKEGREGEGERKKRGENKNKKIIFFYKYSCIFIKKNFFFYLHCLLNYYKNLQNHEYFLI